MSGGKGGSTTTKVQIPAWLEEAAQRNLAKADTLAQIGYTPYYGPDVAAMTPMQIAAMQGTNAAASAFGLPTADPMAGMPTAQNYGGMMAYSSGPLYDQALAELEARMPGQYAALRAPFIDPVTGAPPSGVFGLLADEIANEVAASDIATRQSVERGGRDMSDRGMGSRSSGSNAGGFTGVRDMFDGGGAGKSGSKFSGGPLSGSANRAGISPVGRDGGGMGRGK